MVYEAWKMRITTSKGREFAFKLRAIRNKRSGKNCWYVGLTTKCYFWLDLNTAKDFQAVSLATQLVNRLRTDVYIVQTKKSYWLVTKKKLPKEEWRKEYAFWLNNYSDKVVCHAFCLCCLRYNKATLRVSKKKGNRPKIIMRILLSLYGNHKSLEDWSKSPTPREPLNPTLPCVRRETQ